MEKKRGNERGGGGGRGRIFFLFLFSTRRACKKLSTAQPPTPILRATGPRHRGGGERRGTLCVCFRGESRGSFSASNHSSPFFSPSFSPLRRPVPPFPARDAHHGRTVHVGPREPGVGQVSWGRERHRERGGASPPARAGTPSPRPRPLRYYPRLRLACAAPTCRLRGRGGGRGRQQKNDVPPHG